MHAIKEKRLLGDAGEGPATTTPARMSLSDVRHWRCDRFSRFADTRRHDRSVVFFWGV